MSLAKHFYREPVSSYERASPSVRRQFSKNQRPWREPNHKLIRVCMAIFHLKKKLYILNLATTRAIKARSYEIKNSHLNAAKNQSEKYLERQESLLQL